MSCGRRLEMLRAGIPGVARASIAARLLHRRVSRMRSPTARSERPSHRRQGRTLSDDRPRARPVLTFLNCCTGRERGRTSKGLADALASM
jgi:hypothetical protein